MNLLPLAFPLVMAMALPVRKIPATAHGIFYSPYNWRRAVGSSMQSANPGAYVKLAFTGSQIAAEVDVSPLVTGKVPVEQYPVVRYSVDGGPATTLQLRPDTRTIPCASGLTAGNHRLLLQYVAGYVFLDFWSPVNVVRVTGFNLDEGASIASPTGSDAPHDRAALFLGDSITNGDDNTATFGAGITNSVDTQDATIGYPAIVASGIGAEYGVLGYGGASWDRRAADGHTPGLMSFYSMYDGAHSRLESGKLVPAPDDIFVNMGENSPPSGDDVSRLLRELRSASAPKTQIWLIVPFSGRARAELSSGFNAYRSIAPSDAKTHLIDLGNSPFLVGRPSMYSVDGQHPLAALHGMLGAQLVAARAQILASKEP